jgi:hypothetical protein
VLVEAVIADPGLAENRGAQRTVPPASRPRSLYHARTEWPYAIDSSKLPNRETRTEAQISAAGGLVVRDSEHRTCPQRLEIQLGAMIVDLDADTQ